MAKLYPKEMTSSRLYVIWNGMKTRCYTKSSGEYKHYGAKGIKICDEWHYNFPAFYTWAIDNGYSDNLTIDRIDYNGDYEPKNCRWVGYIQQANNRSDNILLTHNGETHTIAEWSRITGIGTATLQYRKYQKWSDDKILTTPLRKSETPPIIKRQITDKEKWLLISGRRYYNEGNGYLYRDDFSGIIHKLGLSLVQKALGRYKDTWKARQICQRLARIKQLNNNYENPNS